MRRALSQAEQYAVHTLLCLGVMALGLLCTNAWVGVKALTNETAPHIDMEGCIKQFNYWHFIMEINDSEGKLKIQKCFIDNQEEF